MIGGILKLFKAIKGLFGGGGKLIGRALSKAKTSVVSRFSRRFGKLKKFAKFGRSSARAKKKSLKDTLFKKEGKSETSSEIDALGNTLLDSNQEVMDQQVAIAEAEAEEKHQEEQDKFEEQKAQEEEEKRSEAGFFQNILQAAMETFMGFWAELIALVIAVVTIIWSHIKGFVTKLGIHIGDWFVWVGKSLKFLWSTLIGGLAKAIIDTIRGYISKLPMVDVGGNTDAVSDWWDKVKSEADELSNTPTWPSDDTNLSEEVNDAIQPNPDGTVSVNQPQPGSEEIPETEAINTETSAVDGEFKKGQFNEAAADQAKKEAEQSQEATQAATVANVISSTSGGGIGGVSGMPGGMFDISGLGGLGGGGDFMMGGSAPSGPPPGWPAPTAGEIGSDGVPTDEYIKRVANNYNATEAQGLSTGSGPSVSSTSLPSLQGEESGNSLTSTNVTSPTNISYTMPSISGSASVPTPIDPLSTSSQGLTIDPTQLSNIVSTAAQQGTSTALTALPTNTPIVISDNSTNTVVKSDPSTLNLQTSTLS